MENSAKLISAIAQLLWPLLGFAFLIIFKPQLVDILHRLNSAKKLKAGGIEVELDELEASTQKVAEEVVAPELATAAAPAQQPPKKTSEHEIAELLIIRESARSPKAALLMLDREIQKRVRQLLAETNWQQNINAANFAEAIYGLRKQGSLPDHVTESLSLFMRVRNKLIHSATSEQTSDDEVFRAIDSGLTLLRAINAIPVEKNVVHALVPVFSDSKGLLPIAGIQGLVLETTSPDGTTNLRIFPTTRTHFVKGKRVAWEWNMHLVWGPAWYRDPTTNELRAAWGSSAEFIGRHLDDV